MNSTAETVVYRAASIFNGEDLLQNHCAIFNAGIWSNTVPVADAPSNCQVIDLEEDILSPGYVDLQVNGGGGVMFNSSPTVETLKIMATSHRDLGATRILPTLITDSRANTEAAIHAVQQAIEFGVSGICGLHLEGPHLSIAKKGAHDENHIRPMDDADLQLLQQASTNIDVLKVTIAPESVSLEQVRRLSESGVLVALGHTNASYDTCMEYIAAGALCVTHLFNAMSQLGSREPGLAGAALHSDHSFIGLIADGIHVHPATARLAWEAKKNTDRFYLVSDAMAPAGTQMESFTLNGRTIHRNEGQLTLPDGTLAGADLDLTTAIKVMHQSAGIELASALRAATTVPAAVLKLKSLDTGRAEVYKIEDCIRIFPGLETARPIV